jgi:hypothetical protein
MAASNILSGPWAVPTLYETVTSQGTGNNTSADSSSENGNPKILLDFNPTEFGSKPERSFILKTIKGHCGATS